MYYHSSRTCEGDERWSACGCHMKKGDLLHLYIKGINPFIEVCTDCAS
jgi:hypothetical protein